MAFLVPKGDRHGTGHLDEAGSEHGGLTIANLILVLKTLSQICSLPDFLLIAGPRRRRPSGNPRHASSRLHLHVPRTAGHASFGIPPPRATLPVINPTPPSSYVTHSLTATRTIQQLIPRASTAAERSRKTGRRDGAGEPEAGVPAGVGARGAAAAAVHAGGAGREEGHLAAAGVVRGARRHAVAGGGGAGRGRGRAGALDALGGRQHLARGEGPARGLLRRRGQRQRRRRRRRRPGGRQRLEAARVARPRPRLPRPPHPVPALRARRRAQPRQQGDRGQGHGGHRGARARGGRDHGRVLRSSCGF